MDPYDSATDKVCVLGPTLVFKGELMADEDLMLKGRVEGSITHTASLRIGEEGSVKGNVKAKHVTIAGNIDGDVLGGGSVTVRETAKVVGNIFAPRVSLLEGARFNGKIDMNAAEAASGRDRNDTAQADARQKVASGGK
jgi:cytoskeletal protein CcmA (bactofilin family)